MSHSLCVDGVLRSVPLPDQCVGEAEEQQRARELPSSDPSGPFPWQWAEKLPHDSSEQQCRTRRTYVSEVPPRPAPDDFTGLMVSVVFQMETRQQIMTPTCSVTLSGPVGDTRGS